MSSCPSSSLTFVSSDGSVAVLDALPIPDHLIFVVPLGRVEASQLIINETCGVVGGRDIVEVGARGDGAGVVEGACSGAGIDSYYSGGHGCGVGALGGSASLRGSVGGGGSFGAMGAPSSCAFSAPSFRPIGQRSKEEGDDVGRGCVLNSDGRVCVAGISASLVREIVRVRGSSPCGACDSSSLPSVGHQFVFPLWQVTPGGLTQYVLPPEVASSSSGIGVRGVDYQVIGRCDVACGCSDGSASS